jgi:hypothetical protein
VVQQAVSKSSESTLDPLVFFLLFARSLNVPSKKFAVCCYTNGQQVHKTQAKTSKATTEDKQSHHSHYEGWLKLNSES